MPGALLGLAEHSPGLYIRHFPTADSTSAPARPRSLPQHVSPHLYSQCPQVTFSGVLCTCFGSNIRLALKQKTKSESPHSPFSHFSLVLEINLCCYQKS